MQTFSMETKFLLFCSRHNLTKRNVNKYINNLPPDFNWDLFIQQASRHRLLALIATNLLSLAADAIPAKIEETLRTHSHSHTSRNVLFTVTLQKLTTLLSEHSIVAVPFKGPVLALQAYGDIYLRYFTDLDILVSPRDALQAKDILLSQGFAVTPSLSKKQEQSYLKTENFFSLTHPTSRISIDLHWELTGRYSLTPVYLDDISAKLSTVTLLNTTMVCLDTEEMLLYITIHSSSHCWEVWEWVTCLSHLISNTPHLNWQRLLTRARELHCRRMFFLALLLCRRLYEVTIPEEVEDSISKARVETFAEQIILQISNESHQHTENTVSWRFSSFHFLIRDTFLDKIHYAGRLLFIPTIKEWQIWPLPGWLSFLYYGFRPIRLAWGFMRK